MTRYKALRLFIQNAFKADLRYFKIDDGRQKTKNMLFLKYFIIFLKYRCKKREEMPIMDMMVQMEHVPGWLNDL